MDIAKRKYSSTNDFVGSNHLEIEAIALLGSDWQAEDDCSQIENLLKHVGRNDLMVVYHENIKSDYDIEVTDRRFSFSIDDLKDLKYKITQELVEEGLIKDCTDTDEEDEVNCENAIEQVFKKFVQIDYQ